MSNNSESDNAPVVYKSPQSDSVTYQHGAQPHNSYPGSSQSQYQTQYQPQSQGAIQNQSQSYYQPLNQSPNQSQYPTYSSSYPQQYPPQSPPQHPGQYHNQYPGNHTMQYQAPYPGQYPGYPQGQFGQPPMNYGPMNRERGIFRNAFDALFSSATGIAIILPFINMREMLSIKPETPPQEKIQRYKYALPQLLESRGISGLYKNFGGYLARAPALSLDVLFFLALKKTVYPPDEVMSWDISWFGTVLLAASATGLRHLVYQPINNAFDGIRSPPSNAQEFGKAFQNSLKNIHRNKGFKGLYSNTYTSLPFFMLYRGIQLGSIDSSLESIKYREGSTSLFRKFLVCFGCTAIARFLTYPLEKAREKTILEEGSVAKNLKKFTRRAIDVFKLGGKEEFRIASAKSFRASTSAMTFAIFYNLRDEPRLTRY